MATGRALRTANSEQTHAQQRPSADNVAQYIVMSVRPVAAHNSNNATQKYCNSLLS